ncbi:MAG: hypothetical protein ACRCUT_04490 [Spirochaetota bacterium]
MADCKTVMVILVSHRSKSAIEVQKLLTEWGCSIKTRLGIHDGVGNQCSDSGLIVLELVDERTKNKELAACLEKLDGVNVQLVELSV